jgi:DNA-binding FadR family transcriptional regulator
VIHHFTPIEARRTFEEALAQIVDVIRAGEIRVGEKLPSERALAERMGISRPTLREAIRALADAGVVRVRPGSGGGIFVRSDVVPKDVRQASAELRLGEVAGVLEARRLFEPRVAHLAALYATDADFEAMRETIEEQRAIGDDRERFLQLDLRFHLAMAKATQNETVVALMKHLLRRLEIARESAVRTPEHGPDVAIAIHERTLAAIMGGKPAEIEEAMNEHLSYLEQIWEEETGRTLLRRVPDFLLARGRPEGA